MLAKIILAIFNAILDLIFGKPNYNPTIPKRGFWDIIQGSYIPTFAEPESSCANCMLMYKGCPQSIQWRKNVLSDSISREYNPEYCPALIIQQLRTLK